MLLLLGSSLLAVFLALIVGPRRTPGARPFVGLMAAAAVWSLAYAFEITSRSQEWALIWLRIQYLGIPFVGVCWLLIVYELTTDPPRSAARWAWLLLPAAGFAVAAIANPAHNRFHVSPILDLSGPLSLLRFGRGDLYWANWGYSWLLVAAGFVRLMRACRARGPAFHRQASFMGAALGLPAAVNLAYAAGYRPWGALDLTPFAFVVGGGFMVWGVFHASLFSLVPTARTHVFDRIPDGILVADERGFLIDCNAAARRILGRLALGKPLDASPGIWPSLRMTMRQMAGQPIIAPAATVTAPGHEATVSPFGDERREGRGVVVVVRDVSERRRAETELLHREQLLSVLSEVARLLLPVRGTPDYPAIAGLLGEAVKADRVYIALNELREDGALCAAPVAEWPAREAADPSMRVPLQRFAYDAAGLGKWRLRLSDAEVIHGRAADFTAEEAAFLTGRRVRSIMAVPLFTEEGFAGFIGLENCRDGALWSGVEQEFLRNASLYLSLALRRQRTEEALHQSQKFDTMGRLAGGIAHDFNNLLQVINGYAEMALAGLPADDPRASDLQEVVRAGQRAAGLTQQLLAFSRRTTVSSEPNDLHATLTDMRAMLKRLIGERNVLEIRCEAEHSIVEVAPAHVQQIVLNLVVNARDAMPDDGTIRIYTRNLELDAIQSRLRGLPEGRYVALHVEDTGTGMTAEVQSHIFEPFFTTKPRGRGTGLGLATVYGLVRQHQGHISVQSEVGRGTQFSILLPVSRRAVAAAAAAAAPAAAAAGGTLLVVEDEDSVRRLWSQVLSGAGYKILEAESGERALDVAHAYEGRIDALISDVVMPGLNGHQIAAILTTERPGLKVLLISGYPDDADDEAPEDRPDEIHRLPILSKPVSSETLLARVRELLTAEPPSA